MAEKNPTREEACLLYPAHMLDPEDLITFIELSPFRRSWAACSLNDEDLFDLQVAIMAHPKGFPVIKGTGGLRKMRFSPERETRGKSGAYRLCYVYFEEVGIVLLVVAYPKNRLDNISPAGKRAMKKMIEEQHKLLVRGPIQ